MHSRLLALFLCLPATISAVHGGEPNCTSCAKDVTQWLNIGELGLILEEQGDLSSEYGRQAKVAGLQKEEKQRHLTRNGVLRILSGDLSALESQSAELFAEGVAGDWEQQKLAVHELIAKVQYSNALAYRGGINYAEFASDYPGYTGFVEGNMQGSNFSGLYQKWSSRTMQTIQQTLEEHKLVFADFENEDKVAQRLESLNENPGGQAKLLQVALEVEAYHNAQNTKLEHLMQTQLTMESAYQAEKAARKAEKARQWKRLNQ